MADSGQPRMGWRPLAADTAPPKADTGGTGWQLPGTDASRDARPPAFRRAPREYVALPQDTVKVQEPPAAPSQPSFSMLTILLPVVGTLLMLGVMLFAFRGGQALYMLAYAPIMLLSYAASYFSYRSARGKYQEAVAQRETGYRQYLAGCRQTLVRLDEEQRRACVIANPTPMGCLARAERLDRRLWERAPGDEAFLDLRLGLGQLPPSFTIEPPSPPQDMLQQDPLFYQAQAIADEFAVVRDVAITLPLAEVGVAGISGPRYLSAEATRCLLLQLAAHHAPNEVKLILVFPESEMADWAWTRWLPHTWSDDRTRRFVAATPESARRVLSEVEEVLRQRQGGHRAQSDTNAPPPVPAFVFVFADPAVWAGSGSGSVGPLLQLLLTQGPSLGAYTLLLADRPERLAKECSAVVNLTTGGGRLSLVGPPLSETDFIPDRCPTATAEALARALTPLRVQSLDTATELPEVVTLLDLLDAGFVEELPAADSWRQSEPFRSLAVPIGVQAGGELLYLDLHERGHGPHGLMAGATGSGKSELIQSFIASLAVRFHPHEVAVMLIDYKGGGMANAFRDLPHQIGIITNLEGNLAHRALIGLRSEYLRRQRIFDQVGVNAIDDYQRLYRRGQVSEPLPHLAIIADEFAELIQNQPDFMAELVSGVRVGRSLGVHLILATQKPAGVVNDQIWGNTRFRLCLRVEQPEDSSEILKRPDAAAIRRPGRAYFQVGMNEVFEMFQAAWGGASYDPMAGRTRVGQNAIADVELDGTRRRLWPRAEVKRAVVEGQTQLQEIVAYLHDVAESQGISPLPGPCLPPLPETVVLDDVRSDTDGWDGQSWRPTSEWLTPVVGLLDDPASQSQSPLRLPLGSEGHLAIYGAPGSGKTTYLQTLITSLTLDHSPQDLNLYLMDFGARLLGQFESLPHVGGVILPDETERMHRLFGLVSRQIEERKQLLSEAGVGTLAAYRSQAADPPPALVLILDNYVEFRNAYEDLEVDLARIVREGGGMGVHLVLTTSTVNLPYQLGTNISEAVTLELTDVTDYPFIVGRTDGLVPAAGVPGRGLVKGQPPREFQTALPDRSATDAERSAALKDLMKAMASGWTGATAPEVEVLPDVIPLSQLLPDSDTWVSSPESPLDVPLGLDAETLEPALIDLAAGPNFLITGPPGSGMTTMLHTWLLALAERFPPDRVRFYLMGLGDQRLMPFRSLPHTAAYVQDDDSLTEIVDEIDQALEERHQALAAAREAAGGIVDEPSFVNQYPALILAADNLDQFLVHASEANQDSLLALLQRGKNLGFYTLVTGGVGKFASVYDGLSLAIKEGQTGFLIGSGDRDDLSIFNIYSLQVPMAVAGKSQLPGRGYFLRRGRARALQAASCHAGTPGLMEWIKGISQKRQSTVSS